MAITNKIAVGHRTEATSPDAFKAALAEFIAVFLFVFIGLGSVSAYFKISPTEDVTPAGLVGIAVAHGLGIAITVAATANLSGGHVNPAVTFGLILGGHITVLRGFLYWIGQLLGAVAASLVLKWLIVTGEPIAVHGLGAGVSVWGGLVLEIVLTFALVFVVYATAVDPKKGSIGVIAPLVIGFTVLAGHFIGVPYTGASMNPARSFGPALVNLNFVNHWIYWVGPFIGAAIATLVYDGLFLSPETHTPVPSNDF
uniref:Aquaporin-like protein n=1 Tax=Apopellia endiviifolia (species B) TaxID=119729 RepID=C9WCK9_9MARC|nr:aquaporin-like protein [Apopellia endiviifolia (species B)]ACR38903.1 aquaporin-like protein [Apopellia endiviifolia (species B)]